MTDQEVNKAIAELCGKKIVTLPFIPNKITVDENTVFTKEAAHQWCLVYPKGASVNVISNYCEDLNLMHEVEKLLLNDFSKQRTYLEELGWGILVLTFLE